jgi:hypothetical protein
MPNQKAIEGFLKAIGNELATLVQTIETDARDAERADIVTRLGWAAFTAVKPRTRPSKLATAAPHANGVKPKRAPAKPAALTLTKPLKFAKKNGERRSSEDITAQAAQLFAYINAHPGESAEKIARGLSVKTAELPAPIKVLLRE